jgi:hypothetical protein
MPAAFVSIAVNYHHHREKCLAVQHSGSQSERGEHPLYSHAAKIVL